MSKIPDFKLPKIDFKGIDYGLKHQAIDYSKIKVDVTTYYI